MRSLAATVTRAKFKKGPASENFSQVDSASAAVRANLPGVTEDVMKLSRQATQFVRVAARGGRERSRDDHNAREGHTHSRGREK